MYVLLVPNALRGICLFPFKTLENNDNICYYQPVAVIITHISDITTQLSTQCSDFIDDRLPLKIFTGIPAAGHMSKAWSHCYYLFSEAKTQCPFPANLAWFLLYRISKNSTPKPTWISLTLFADRTRQTPTARQNAPVRKKLESTDAMVSWGFHAGSLCCLNALLSGHLEGGAAPSWGGKLVLPFIFFLVRERNNILVLESVSAEILSLLLGDCIVCSSLHYGEELLIN